LNGTFLNDILGTIVERGRAIIERQREPASPGEDLAGLAEALLSGRGEASGVAMAAQLLDGYRLLEPPARGAFFVSLARRFGAPEEPLEAAARAFLAGPDARSAQRLHDASEPRRQELIRRLNRAPGGTAALVAMRADLLALVPEQPELAIVDHDFEHLLASWFNRGFLVLGKIGWSTPAVILEKIIRYEAVHRINGWDDLRRRIDPPDRRLYAFFHPALIDDPLIFVEVALTGEMPSAIGPILAEARAPIRPAEATTAVFYSISNCQAGLKGISFGSFLIKQVVEELARAHPNLKTFVTLSPLPGFRQWLETERRGGRPGLPSAGDQALLERLDEPGWVEDGELRDAAGPVLARLAASYLLLAKTAQDRPLDPVARFHLGNGARLERVDVLADVSAKALAQSHGVMVNYLYDPRQIERQHEAFANDGTIAAAPAVRRLARGAAETGPKVTDDAR